MYSEERGTYRVEKKVRAGGDQGAAVDTRIPTASHSRTTRGREHNVGAVVYATEKKEYEEKAIMFPDNEPICQAVSTDPEMITKKKKKDHHRNPFAAIFCCCRGKETRRDKEKKKMRIQEHKQKESKKRKKNKKDKKDKVDAQVCVCPATTNCACQVTEETSYQEQTTQVYQLKEASQSISRELCRDVEVDAVNKTCTCATQFMSCIRNVSTFHKTKSLTKTKSCKDASTMHYKAGRRELRKDNATSCRDCNKHSSKCAGHHSFLQMDALQTSATQCQLTPRKHHAPPPDLYIPTCSKKLKSGIPRLSLCSKSDTGTSMDSIHSISSIRSDDGTKTDTTVCSMATIRYDEMPKKKNKLRVTVVTKSNRSTATDTQKVCDVSTVTSDWWSPILERKDKSIMLARRGGCPELVPQRSPRTRHVGVSTEGRTVKFKSRAQIIPTLKKDILSPSRYLLESQKYYNELFSSKVYAPHVLSINTMQRQEDKKRSVNRRSGRRNHKAKRLVECYSPRKMMAREHVWTAETKNLKTSSGHHKKHRVGVRQKRSQLSEKSHDAPTLDVKVGEVNMLTRQYDGKRNNITFVFTSANMYTL
ncbi:uncharacterized protein LOC126376935 [Pectinophora gossypiella]|uniref:uncharacterized protein LOC126376935 n=1 Tax=Pectinophora gossypiella TaxID=13191 RepID=UPI00214E7AD7|nr:uncharacterized protein LOC126376935 [Pectinophora gossypiella]